MCVCGLKWVISACVCVQYVRVGGVPSWAAKVEEGEAIRTGFTGWRSLPAGGWLGGWGPLARSLEPVEARDPGMCLMAGAKLEFRPSLEL